MPDLERVKHAVTDQPVADTILRRWSPRAFADIPVSTHDLKTLFTAASWAASSQNEQPWRFIVGIKPAPGNTDDTYTKLFRSLAPGNQDWAAGAPVLYASIAKSTFAKNGSPNKTAMHDVGAASATLSLEATRLGLHTHGMGGFDPELLRASFGIPSDFQPVAIWAIGYLGDPANLSDKYRLQEQEPRERNPLSSFVFRSWDKAAAL